LPEPLIQSHNYPEPDFRLPLCNLPRWTSWTLVLVNVLRFWTRFLDNFCILDRRSGNPNL